MVIAEDWIRTVKGLAPPRAEDWNALLKYGGDDERDNHLVLVQGMLCNYIDFPPIFVTEVTHRPSRSAEFSGESGSRGGGGGASHGSLGSSIIPVASLRLLQCR